MNDDRFGNLGGVQGYRHLFAWSERLDREWPFLASELGRAPERSVVDLGCGPGEHLGRLATEGWSAVGIDLSPAQIDSARTHHPQVEFHVGSMDQLDVLTARRFGAALCLGNVLPNIDDATFAKTLEQLRLRLLPGGVVILQLLDFTRILSGRRRAIGPVFRPPRAGAADTDETVFLRLFRPGPDERHVHFIPITFTLHASGEPVLDVDPAQRVVHRAWTEPELRTLLRGAGFEDVRAFGNLQGTAHDPTHSDDLVLVARIAAAQEEP